MTACPLCEQSAESFVRYLNHLICKDCMGLIMGARERE